MLIDNPSINRQGFPSLFVRLDRMGERPVTSLDRIYLQCQEVTADSTTFNSLSQCLSFYLWVTLLNGKVSLSDLIFK